MAGGVWAYYLSFIYPQFAIDPLVTIGMVLMVYLGGRGTIWGPVIGAFILVPAQKYLAYRLGASDLYLVGYSGVFLVVILLLPRGHPAVAHRPRPRGCGRGGRRARRRRRRSPRRERTARGRRARASASAASSAVDECTFARRGGARSPA